MKHEYFFLSGLPRSGSTLLSAILSQNPLIHSEGNSPLLQYLLDMHISVNQKAKEQLEANKKYAVVDKIIRNIPDAYYTNTEKQYVIDKSRTWTYPDNVNLIKRYITPTPKIIVMVRPLEEIVASFVNLYISNGRQDYNVIALLGKDTDPIMRPYQSLVAAMQHCKKECIFITYDYLVYNTKETLNEIYKFLELPPFEHNLSNIVNANKEDDSVYGLLGMHDVRSSIGKAENLVQLSEDVIKHCKLLNTQIGL